MSHTLLRNRSLFYLIAVLSLVSPARSAEPQPPKGFTALFNGKDLSGWHGRQGDYNPYKLAAMPEAERRANIEKWTENAKRHWRAENGELVCDGEGAFLTTDKDYGDIELLIDFKIQPKGDSGIYLKATPQVQIWDYTKESGYGRLGADMGSGGLWNNSRGAPGKDPLVRADKPIGEWNSFRIIQLGERTTVYLNGQLVVKNARLENFWNPQDTAPLQNALKKLQADGASENQKKVEDLQAKIQWLKTRPLMPKGPIQLQTHQHPIHWRNIYIREIPADEANELLRKLGPQAGFESVFNGKDFTGWAGNLQGYQIEDGVIQCKPGKGGNIYTKEEYGDFIARLEFKMPPREPNRLGGNNGLAIRYPGRGDPAYVGMCELQVLDDDPRYKLDPRQAHGSAYGMVAAHRGYQRPVGEWNYQEVTIKGSTIKVELNGTLILDTDLSKVTKYMANSKHPGKENARGYFGFAGHSDPVAFRNIAIKRLDK